jgi:cytoskeleton protein RodZ
MTANESATRVVSDSGNDIGPGQRLREAREAANLTLNEVASRMRLEPQVLELLENDHYERLHGPTFVRGYLSGYARLLDLPPRPILEAYERHDYRPPALVSELGRKPEIHVSDFPVRMVTYVIAGLLVVLVVLWWQSRQLHPGTLEHADGNAQSTAPIAESSANDTESIGGVRPAPDMTPAAQTTQPAHMTTPIITSGGGETAQAAAAAAKDTLAASGASLEQAQSATERPSPPLAAVDAVPEITAGTPSENASQAVAGVSGPTESAVAPLTSTAPAEGSDTSAIASVEEGVVQPPRPAPLPGSDRLAIRLARESWVEIYDRGGGRLYYSLASEGSEVVVEGAGPMRVLLGDIDGAAVDYNGKPFDLSRFKGRSVVRFTVGKLSGTTTPESSAPARPEEPLTRETLEPADGEHQDTVANASEALITPSPAAKPAVTNKPPAITAEPLETTPTGVPPDS